MPLPQEIDELADELHHTKAAIARMRERQLELEEALAKLVGTREEGTISFSTQSWKVSTTSGLNRSLELHDPEWYRERLGDRFDDLLTTKLSLRLSEFRRATADEQRVLVEHMVVKPKKVAVKIESAEVA